MATGADVEAGGERTRRRVMWRGIDDFGRVSVAVLLSAVLGVVLAVSLPPLAEVLKLSAISLEEWGLALLVAGLCALWAEPLKLIGRRAATGRGSSSAD